MKIVYAEYTQVKSNQREMEKSPMISGVRSARGYRIIGLITTYLWVW